MEISHHHFAQQNSCKDLYGHPCSEKAPLLHQNYHLVSFRSEIQFIALQKKRVLQQLNLVSKTLFVIVRNPFRILRCIRTFRFHIEHSSDVIVGQKPANVVIIDESQVTEFTVTRRRSVQSSILRIQ